MRILQSGTFAGVALGLACVLLAPATAQAVEVIGAPTLTMDPNDQTPLAGVVELETDEAVRVELTISDGIDPFTVSFPDAALQHYLPVLGMKPDRTYSVEINLLPGGPAGTVFATTPRLPDDFPTLVVNVSDPDNMEPGLTLLDGPIRNRGAGDTRPTYAIIVNEAGEVVWYSTLNFTAGILQENGDLVFMINNNVFQQDLLGNTRSLIALQHPGLGLHHDFIWTSEGTGLSLGRRNVEIPDYPTSTTDPDASAAPATVLYATVVEFFRDGTLRKEWEFIDMIDITRISYDSLNTNTNGSVWTWSNGLNYNPENDSIMVSLRHQDAVVNFSRQTGQLQWILGNHDNWSPEFQQYLLTPVGTPFRWQFHQHAPMWTAAGNVMVFDNGNHRASPFDGSEPLLDSENFSRGVEFEIDQQAMEVRQVWEYGENIEPRIMSRFLSDSDSLEQTGNRLMTFGGTNFVGGVASADLGLGTTHSRIIETTGDVVPVTVWELIAYDGTETAGQIAIYRSDRIPGLYPRNYVKAPNGVGNSVRLDKIAGTPEASWGMSPVDATHSPADFYMVYASNSPSDGFVVSESTASTVHQPTGALTFYKLLAGNQAGTSTDVPAP